MRTEANVTQCAPDISSHYSRVAYRCYTDRIWFKICMADLWLDATFSAR